MPRSYYPPMSLGRAIDIPRTIIEANAGYPMNKPLLGEQLGYTAEANVFRELLTSSRNYGFTNEGYQAQSISVTELGEEVIKGNLNAIFEALLNVETFREFYERYREKALPPENVLRSFFTEELGVPERQLDRVIEGVLTDGREWKLVVEMAGVERVVSQDVAKSRIESNVNELPVDLEIKAEPSLVEAAQERPQPQAPVSRIEPQLQLNIQIHIAADTPHDSIEVVFRNMAKYLLDARDHE